MKYFKNPTKHDIQHQTTTTTTSALLTTALVLFPNPHVKHRHLNINAFYVSFHFFEMQGKVFLYAERQFYSRYRISFFFLRINSNIFNFFNLSSLSFQIRYILHSSSNPILISSAPCCHKLVLCLLCKRLPVSINIDYYERLTPMIHSLFLERGNHGNHKSLT